MTQELFVLSGDRSVFTVERFLNRFLPDRIPVTLDYPIPECSDNPRLTLKGDAELMEYLAAHITESYGVYWNDSSPTSFRQAMAFYTRDGAVILGLAVDTPNPEPLLNEMVNFVKGKFFCFGNEQRPPESAAEFIAQCGS